MVVPRPALPAMRLLIPDSAVARRVSSGTRVPPARRAKRSIRCRRRMLKGRPDLVDRAGVSPAVTVPSPHHRAHPPLPIEQPRSRRHTPCHQIAERNRGASRFVGVIAIPSSSRARAPEPSQAAST